MIEHRESAAQGWTSLVPELFFDIIARVLPGSYLIMVAGVMFAKGRSTLLLFTKSNAGPAVVILLLVAGLGYSTSMVICPLADLIPNIYRHRNWKRVASRHRELLDSEWLEVALATDRIGQRIESYTRVQCEALDRYLQERLKETDRHAQLLLAKMEAEYFFCANFATSSLLLVIAAFSHYGIRHILGWELAAFLIAVAFLAWWANAYLGIKLFERQFALLALSCGDARYVKESTKAVAARAR